MTDITIPREALDEGAWKVCTRWDCQVPCKTCTSQAHHAFLAMIKAWRGQDVQPCLAEGKVCTALILPLPKEPSNG